MEDLFPVVESLVEEVFDEEAELVRSAVTLTLAGDIDFDDDDAEVRGAVDEARSVVWRSETKRRAAIAPAVFDPPLFSFVVRPCAVVHDALVPRVDRAQTRVIAALRWLTRVVVVTGAVVAAAARRCTWRSHQARLGARRRGGGGPAARGVRAQRREV
jgi:hypothetical protein